MADNSFVEDATKGMTKGTLEYGESKIKSLAKQFLQGKLAFIEDEETIQLVRSQRKKAEWKSIRKYISDTDMKILIQMGFSLRQLNTQKDRKKFLDLRTKIVKKYKSNGLHVAEMVSCGIFIRLVSLLLGQVDEESDIKERLDEILVDVDKYVVFIQSSDKKNNISKIIISKIQVLSPKIIIVFSLGASNIKKAEKIIKLVKETITDYHFELQVDASTLERYDFILKEVKDYLFFKEDV